MPRIITPKVLVPVGMTGLIALIAILGGAERPYPPPNHAAQPQQPDPLCESLDCIQIFPANNPWNQDISGLPIHPNSANFIATIGLTRGLHPDFGTVWEGAPNGIPYMVVPWNQPPVEIIFTAYGNESDPGPYPVPANAPIEGGPNATGDRHVLIIDPARAKLYELYRAFPQANGSWRAESGAVWNLNSNQLRREGWTSADAAGLPIFPGLVRYEEAVIRGEIRHALRFTVNRTQRGYIHPATHFASSSTNPNHAPMGMRVRLRSTLDVNTFAVSVRPMLRAMQRYGMIVADNGSDWYVSGAPDPRWNEDDIHQISRVKGSDFVVVDTGPIIR